MDLNKDFKDGYAPIYALYHYSFANKTPSLETLNRHLNPSGDQTSNIRLLYSLMSKSNLIPLISEDEYLHIK